MSSAHELDLLKSHYSFGGLDMSQIAKPYVDVWLRTRTIAPDSSGLLLGEGTYGLRNNVKEIK
jgi:hypothetical protein